MRLEKLLSPGKIGTLELKNRFVVPPMGTNFATYDGEVTDEMIACYRRRARGGFGLIIIEVTAIDRKGKAIVNEAGLWEDAQIPGFRKLMDAIHEEGGKVVVQLHHAGRQSVPPYIFNEMPEAPSRVACPMLNYIPEAMTNARVWEVIDAFGDAAVRAKKAGADGVVYEQGGTEHTCSGYDTIVPALGVRPDNPLEEAVRALGKEVYVIGDAAKPAPANKATEAALEAVLKLG